MHKRDYHSLEYQLTFWVSVAQTVCLPSPIQFWTSLHNAIRQSKFLDCSQIHCFPSLFDRCHAQSQGIGNHNAWSHALFKKKKKRFLIFWQLWPHHSDFFVSEVCLRAFCIVFFWLKKINSPKTTIYKD